MSILPDAPCCPHGPAAYFSRTTAKGVKTFFACSAYRKRKGGCSFYQDKVQKIKKPRFDIKEGSENDNLRRSQIQSFSKSFQRSEKLDFCVTCSLLLFPVELKSHIQHETITSLSVKQLYYPSRLLCPHIENSSFAQAHFTDETIQCVLRNLERLNFKRIICLGCPTVHEEAYFRYKSKRSGIESILLDIDDRYGQFFNKKRYCRYNMFNHWFFNDAAAKKLVKKFIRNATKICFIVDPPFGGLIQLLTFSVEKLTNYASDAKNVFIALFMPYFMEQKIMEHLPSLSMLDFVVKYRSDSNKITKASTVRIFTNIPGNEFKLPSANYRFCRKCQRDVGLFNKHCAHCENCSSKNGRTYWHCFQCKRCVKPSWVHCSDCRRCHLEHEDCARIPPPQKN